MSLILPARKSTGKFVNLIDVLGEWVPTFFAFLLQGGHIDSRVDKGLVWRGQPGGVRVRVNRCELFRSHCLVRCEWTDSPLGQPNGPMGILACSFFFRQSLDNSHQAVVDEKVSQGSSNDYVTHARSGLKANIALVEMKMETTEKQTKDTHSSFPRKPWQPRECPVWLAGRLLFLPPLTSIVYGSGSSIQAHKSNETYNYFRKNQKSFFLFISAFCTNVNNLSLSFPLMEERAKERVPRQLFDTLSLVITRVLHLWMLTCTTCHPHPPTHTHLTIAITHGIEY